MCTLTLKNDIITNENSVESDRFSLIGVPVFYLGE